MTTQFSDLGLQPTLLETLTELGYTAPTPIQEGVIPLALTGQDVIGQAQTGTGKTAAFALPILNTITPEIGHVQALVLAPTRELAMQVSKSMYQYGSALNVRVLAIYGGQPYGRQISRLKKGVDVVVGTPGRLLDLIKRGSLDLSQVETVVLDEADEMLSMGFIEDIETILDATPTDRQTTLFSATMPAPIRRLANKYMQEPQAVTIKRKQLTGAAIEQRYYLVNEKDKLAALTRLFEVEPITRALIFARTRVGTGELANELTVRGFPAEALNGDLSQDARERVMRRFRQDQIKVLVATDVAARGLDIDDISHVFNFDLPPDPEVFVHRVGRTGRAGKAGIALSLVTPQQQRRLRRIESYARQKLTQTPVPTIEEIQTKRESELQERMMVWLRRGRCRKERTMVENLVEEGMDPIEIAAAALKLARAEEKQRPIANMSPVNHRQSSSRRERGRGGRNGRFGNNDRSNGKGRNGRFANNGRAANNGRSNGHGNGKGNNSKRSHEAGMVRLSMNVGKAQGIRPNDIVGSIAYHADIPGRSIGAIRIQEEHTFVDIPQELVTQVLDKAGNYNLRETAVVLERS